MNKLFITILFFVIHYSLILNYCEAQWQPDVLLSNTSGNSYTTWFNVRNVASNENIVHVVWMNALNGNKNLYYKKSTNEGISWGTNTLLTNDSVSGNPSIALSGLVVHVVWEKSRDGNREIYYKQSTNEGISWEPEIRLTNDTNDSKSPSIWVMGSFVHVAWSEFRDGNWEIYYKRSTDGGINWEVDTRLTNNTADSNYPSLSVSDSVVHIIWEDFRSGIYGIYYKRSTDGGSNWGADTRLSNAVRSSRFPSLSSSDSIVHIAWEDLFGIAEIYYKRSSDGGVTFGPDERLTNASGYSDAPCISASNSFVHVVWFDGRDGNSEIYYKRSEDQGINWGPDTRLTNNSSFSYFPSVTVSEQVVHVVWDETQNGNDNIYYKRNPTGNVGVSNVGTEIPKSLSLSQNYPNPFNPTTKIKFDIPKKAFVKLIIYDLIGKEVTLLVKEELNTGSYEAEWDARWYPSGVYFYRIEVGGLIEMKSMVLLK